MPLDITFRGMSPSRSVEAAIDRWLVRIELAFDRVQRCSVVVEQPHHHHGRGNAFHVRIELEIPGDMVSVADEHADVYVALGDAFRAARRRLHDRAHIRRGDVKQHVA